MFTSPRELVRAMMSSIAVFDYDVSRETVSEAMNPYLGCQSREEALVKRDLLDASLERGGVQCLKTDAES